MASTRTCAGSRGRVRPSGLPAPAWTLTAGAPPCLRQAREHSHRPDPAGLGPSGCAAGGAAANGSRPGRLPTVFFERAGCELSALPGASVLNPRGLVRDVAIDMIPATVMVRRWRRRRWCGATAVSAGPAAAPQSMPLAGIA